MNFNSTTTTPTVTVTATKYLQQRKQKIVQKNIKKSRNVLRQTKENCERLLSISHKSPKGVT